MKIVFAGTARRAEDLETEASWYRQCWLLVVGCWLLRRDYVIKYGGRRKGANKVKNILKFTKHHQVDPQHSYSKTKCSDEKKPSSSFHFFP